MMYYKRDKSMKNEIYHKFVLVLSLYYFNIYLILYIIYN